MQPVPIEVIAPLPEGWGICLSCEMLMARANLDKAPAERGLDEYPPEWQEDFHRLSELIFDLAARYGNSILIRIWDPRSLQGMIRSIRYGVRRYPTFVVAGHKMSGWDTAGLERTLAKALGSSQGRDGSAMTQPDQITLWKHRARQAARALGDMLYGATIYEMVRDLNKERGSLERMFVLIVFGDLLGVPVLPPYYTLRLLPYVMPNITGWRRSMLRERDLTDLCDQEIT